jgi:hypothetical protein
MNSSKPATRSDSEEEATDEIVERQQDLILELHELLTAYGPTWYTEEIDLRLRETLALCTSITQAHATLLTIEQTRNSNRVMNYTHCGDQFEACVRDTLGWAGSSPLNSLANTATGPLASQLTLGSLGIPASKSPNMRIKELRKMRKPLWERFEKNPTEIQLAADLRIIDDLIADCNEKRNHCDEIVQSRPQVQTAPACRECGLPKFPNGSLGLCGRASEKSRTQIAMD